MAGTTTNSRPMYRAGASTHDVIIQYNKLVDDVEALRAALNTLATNFNATLTKMDADAGITDTNYSALGAVTRTTYDTASDMTGAKVGNETGTAISA